MHCVYICCFFFFKQKTAYEMRISDWSSDVCSSDLAMNPSSQGSTSARSSDRRPVSKRSDALAGSPAAGGAAAACTVPPRSAHAMKPHRMNALTRRRPAAAPRVASHTEGRATRVIEQRQQLRRERKRVGQGRRVAELHEPVGRGTI